MGNCVRKGSTKGDQGYWESSPMKKSLLSGETYKGNGRREAAGDGDSGDRKCSSDGKRAVKEVKIKITKKQLEELMGMKEMHGLTLDQVLSRLMDGGDGVFEANDQGPWRPKLHTIPE